MVGLRGGYHDKVNRKFIRVKVPISVHTFYKYIETNFHVAKSLFLDNNPPLPFFRSFQHLSPGDTAGE